MMPLEPPEHGDRYDPHAACRLTADALTRRIKVLAADVADLERRCEALRDEALAAHRARLDAL